MAKSISIGPWLPYDGKYVRRRYWIIDGKTNTSGRGDDFLAATVYNRNWCVFVVHERWPAPSAATSSDIGGTEAKLAAAANEAIAILIDNYLG